LALLLRDERDALQVVSSSNEEAQLFERFQLEAEEGPCVESVHTGRQVTVLDIHRTTRWPRFTEQARQASSFRAVHALPLSLRSETVGALNLFNTRPREIDESDLHLGQALADIATIGILHERAIRRQEIIAEQLRGALHSRILIEQAKGVLSESGKLGIDEAFHVLRHHARANNQRLSTLAHAVVERQITFDDLQPPRSRKPS
jgi:transcriptional regulator with GAF, ATPase, and Fis domain